MKAPHLWPLLTRHLPPERLALLLLVAQHAREQGMPAYLVGGFVRDALLGRPSLDFDIVVEGWAPRLAHALAQRYGGRVQVHRRFGTAKWWLPEPHTAPWAQALRALVTVDDWNPERLPAFLDLVTARRERYPHPGALPEVEPADLQADLQRRDFTINAMAFPLTDRPEQARLIDPFGGYRDLQHRVLRALHPRSFHEDPTRLTRAARYAARYAFDLAPETQRQIPQGLEVVPAVSGDRWRHELDHILDEGAAPRALALLARWGLLERLHPRLPREPEALQRVALGQPPPRAWAVPDPWHGLPLTRVVRYALWLLELDPRSLRAVDERLHFPRALRDVVLGAARLWHQRTTWHHLAPGALTLYLERHPLPAVYAVYLVEPEPEHRQRLEAFATQWRHIPAPLTGHDLKALGLPPGPLYRELLLEARKEAIEGRLRSREQALDWVRTRLTPGSAPHSPPVGGDP